MKDHDFLFHEKWLGLAQPVEGLVFSVPALADAQIAPEVRPDLSASFEDQLDPRHERIRDLATFFRSFLGYSEPGMLVPQAELPDELSFYAAEGGQELRPSFALGRGPFTNDDPFAAFETKAEPNPATPGASPAGRYFAFLWDLTEAAHDVDLDATETLTGPWRYPPTAKFERLLRHVGIPIGLLFNGQHLRLVYAPPGETTGHLTFRVEHLQLAEGRPLLAALDLLLHARRAYNASSEYTLEGLLKESRRRQADVTEALAKQVFEAVELLVAGFEAASNRDAAGGRLDWLRPALEAEGDHFYQGVLSLILRLVFLLYAEDQSLLPVQHPTFAEHLSLAGLYQRLTYDAGAHPESMHHRFGAYGQLLALFRAVFFGVKHGTLELPPRRGRLFDPNAYPFLEGGLPEWTAAVTDPAARAAAQPPSIDDGTVYKVLHRLVVFEGQRLSYRTLDVEQIGSVYESLMGYHVLRLESPAVRMGKFNVWVETRALRALSPTDRARFLKEICGLNPGPIQATEKLVKEGGTEAAFLEGLSAHAVGKKADIAQHRAEAGRLVLQPGEERRRTGSHYTPRWLAEKVVKRTLEPLLACLGEARTAEQILQLKICDPAMGSGAFLVATCRELASEIVAAWTRSGALARIVEEHGDAHLHARRLVAQQCLYGVDKNAAAVELAKLSLWLVTLGRDRPFTFVDHALRHGDSLVGLDFKQIEAFHWKPPGQVETCRTLLRDTLNQAVELRQQLHALAGQEDPASQADKRRLLEFSQQTIDRVRLVADVCVGAFFDHAKDSAREKERNRRLGLVETWLGGSEKAAEAYVELAELGTETRKALKPFHWWLEFPEVFFQERPDPLQGGTTSGAALMEGVIGNPPFASKNGIVSSTNREYIPWLLASFGGSHGNADLCAYFFRRSAQLIGDHGALGLIATNTISQGDTRRTGLATLLGQGFSITAADTDMPWLGEAAVTISFVALARGSAIPVARPIRNGKSVHQINSRLEPANERQDARALSAMASKFFMGSKIYGEGFFLNPHEALELLKDERNREVIFRAIGGEEVNTEPQQRPNRFVISFGRKSLEAAHQWTTILRIVESRVKPERDRANEATADGAHRKKYWWQHAQPRPELYTAISTIERCLVTSNVTKHLVFSFQPTSRIFAHTLYVFPIKLASAFAVLQSRTHEPWARLLSSSMKTDLRYSASDCFETFPFPKPDPHTVIPELEAIGEKLYETRARFMVDTNQGLTKAYNALKDPSCDDPRVLELRRLHEEMDRAVLAAYGWGDVVVPPYCPLNDADRAALQAFEDEVIDRLYVLNEERAREEKRLGLTGKKGRKASAESDEGDETAEAEAPAPAKGKAKKSTAKAKGGKGQGDLFGE